MKKIDLALTKRVLEFQREGKGEEALSREISLIIYDFPQRCLGWDEDESSTFYLMCQDKISNLLGRFHYTGVPFECYLKNYLQWRARSHRQLTNQQRIQEEILSSPNFWTIREPEYDFIVSERNEIADYIFRKFPVNPDGQLAKPAMRQRIFILCLKFPYHVQITDFPLIAKLTGIPLAVINHSVSNIRTTLTYRRERIRQLQNRRNEYHYKIQLLQKRLHQDSESLKAARNKRVLIEMKRRKDRLNKAIGGIPMTPTHSDIAMILRIPKGTVDSSLFYLRKIIKDIPEISP